MRYLWTNAVGHEEKNVKTQFLTQTTLAFGNRLSEKVYLEENEIKLIDICL